MSKLVDILYKRGLITEEDRLEVIKNDDNIKELSSPYRTKVHEVVSNMYHYHDGKKYEGERYSMNDAKEVYEKYRKYIDNKYTCEDIYIAINAQYHDYENLFSEWFDEIDHKIIKSAIIFWFMDDDYTGNKVKDYFKL